MQRKCLMLAADLGCYGGREPVSPVLDGLAANRIKFTQGGANSPVCCRRASGW